MKKLSECLDVVSQSRNRWQELKRRANTACRSMDEECKNIGNEIITYWMNNGAVTDKYFKYNKRFSDWGRYNTIGEDYAYCHIIKLIRATNEGILCVAERFNSGYCESESQSLIIGRHCIETQNVHPDCVISKEEYENAKKSFVDGLLNCEEEKNKFIGAEPDSSFGDGYVGECI